MGNLRGDLAARPMHRIGHCFEIREDLGAEPDLIRQRSTGFLHRQIGHGAHAYPALCQRAMVLEHGLGRHALFGHVLVGRRFDKSVAQGDGADLERLPHLGKH